MIDQITITTTKLSKTRMSKEKKNVDKTQPVSCFHVVLIQNHMHILFVLIIIFTSNFFNNVDRQKGSPSIEILK